MRPVAIGRAAGMFARAHGDALLHFDDGLDRCEARALVRTVAPRLILRPSARAPEIVARFHIQHAGLLVRNHRIRHAHSLSTGEPVPNFDAPLPPTPVP